jgi:hypothetical protein
MKIGAFKRALGLAFLYICLFVLIVLVQFSRGPGLSEKIGGLTVTATYPKSDRGKPGSAPDSLRLSYAGLVLELSPKSAAEGLGPDGSPSPLTLASIDRLPSGLRIKLSPGVELKASAEKGAVDRFALALTAAPDGIAAVRLRLLPSSRVRFLEKDGRRSLSSNGESWDIGLAAGSLDGSSGLLTLRAGDPGLVLARAEAQQPRPQKPAGSEKLAAQAPKDPEVIRAEISAWRDKAWSGLSGARFDPDKIAWKGQDGNSAFSEKALAVYLAESLARGSYQDSLSRVKAAKDKWPDKLGFLSAPYFGGLVRKMSDMSTADQAEVKRLSQLVADKSPTVFEKEGLLRFLVDRAPYSLAQDALRFAAGVDPAKLTIRQDLGLLGCVVEARASLKDDDNPLREGGAAADRLAAAVRKSSSGFFLATEEDGSCDLRLSLIAGGYLEAYGASSSKPALVGVGQSLVEGVLGLADAQGFAPARILAPGAAAEQKSGSLAPEDFYALVADNPYYPHEASFAKDLGPGAWAWTCSPSLAVQASASRDVFSASFPAGRSHFLAIYGMKPFANIQLYGIDYSPDNDFESYDASGYLYEKSAGALFLKMKHKKESEDIQLSF